MVAFYATRSLEPARWYAGGTAFDDVPRRYRANVNTVSLPYNRRPGMPAALSVADIDAIVAFLATLTDAPFDEAARRNLETQATRRRHSRYDIGHESQSQTRPRTEPAVRLPGRE